MLVFAAAICDSSIPTDLTTSLVTSRGAQKSSMSIHCRYLLAGNMHEVEWRYRRSEWSRQEWNDRRAKNGMITPTTGKRMDGTIKSEARCAPSHSRAPIQNKSRDQQCGEARWPSPFDENKAPMVKAAAVYHNLCVIVNFWVLSATHPDELPTEVGAMEPKSPRPT